MSQGDKVIKLLSMQQHGPSLKLTISIEEKYVNAGTSIESIEYNIHNFIKVRFKASRGQGYQAVVKCDLTMKKHSLVKDMTVSLKVASQDVNFSHKEMFCSDDWCAWIPIGSMNMNNYNNCGNNPLAVNIDITVSKTQSVINAKLFNDEEFTDFALSASGEHGRVAVHKAYLAAHSDAFTTMFQGQWKETEQSHIELKGVSLKTVQHFKEYLYLSTLPKTNEDLRGLLLLAKLYLVDSLKAECTLKLLQTMTAENLDDLVEFCTENKFNDLLSIIHDTTPESVLARGYGARIKKLMDSEFLDELELSLCKTKISA